MPSGAKAFCIFKHTCMTKPRVLEHRIAADKIWEMAKEFQAKGSHDVAAVLFDMAERIHFISRQKEKNLK